MTKQCPFCAEEILPEAIKCKHCGEMLDGSTAKPPPVQKVVVKKKTSTGTWGCLIIILMSVGFCVYVGNEVGSSRPASAPAPSSSPAPENIELTASVRFTGTQFIIENRDSFDWVNVEMQINYGIISNGYYLKVARMSAGETYTMGAMTFANSDGERFNPVSMKPTKFLVKATTPKGMGYYFGGWD